MNAANNRAHVVRLRVRDRLKRVSRWREGMEQAVWGSCHDLHPDVIDMDDTVNIMVRERPWEQLHGVTDPWCQQYSTVE